MSSIAGAAGRMGNRRLVALRPGGERAAPGGRPRGPGPPALLTGRAARWRAWARSASRSPPIPRACSAAIASSSSSPSPTRAWATCAWPRGGAAAPSSAPPALPPRSVKRSSGSAREIPIMLSPNMSVARQRRVPRAGRHGPPAGRGLRRRDHRGPPPLQEGRSQRHRARMAEVVAEALGPRSDEGGRCTAATACPASAPQQEIGIRSIRSGDVVGEHTVTLRQRWASGSS